MIDVFALSVSVQYPGQIFMRNIDIHVSICWATDMYEMHMLYSQLVLCGCKGSHMSVASETSNKSVATPRQDSTCPARAHAVLSMCCSCYTCMYTFMCDRHMHLHYCTHTITTCCISCTWHLLNSCIMTHAKRQSRTDSLHLVLLNY